MSSKEMFTGINEINCCIEGTDLNSDIINKCLEVYDKGKVKEPYYPLSTCENINGKDYIN